MMKFNNKHNANKALIIILILVSLLSSVSLFIVRAKVRWIEKDLYRVYVASLTTMLESKDPVQSISYAISSLDLYYSSKSYFKLTTEEISTRDFVRNLLFGIQTIKRRDLDDTFLNEDWSIIYNALYEKIEEKGVFDYRDLASVYDELRNENLRFLFSNSFFGL